jgi:hypothetical protein
MQRLSGIIENRQVHPAEVIAEAATPNHRCYACVPGVQFGDGLRPQRQGGAGFSVPFFCA